MHDASTGRWRGYIRDVVKRLSDTPHVKLRKL